MGWTARLLTLLAAALLIVPIAAILISRSAPAGGAAGPGTAAPGPTGSGAATGAAPRDGRPPSDGEIAQVIRGPLTRSISTPGVVSPLARVRLGFDQSGVLKELNVQAGDRVRAGDVLAKLDTSRLELQVQQADSALALARLRRDAARNAPKEELVAARAAVQAAQARLDALKQPASATELATARATLAGQQAAVQAARARLEQVRGSGSSLTPLLSNLNDLRQRLRSAADAGVGGQGGSSPADLTPALQALLGQLDALAVGDVGTAEVEAARAATAAAKARLDEVAAGARPADILAAEANLAAATSAVSAAELRLQRVRQGASTVVEIVQAMAEVESARQAAEKAKAEFDRLATWRVSPQDVQLAELAVQAAQAQLDDALSAHQAVLQRVGDPAHPEVVSAASRISTTAALVETARTRLATLAGAPSSVDVQATQAALQARQSELAEAQAKLSRLRAAGSGREVAEAQAALDAATAAQRAAQAQLDRLKAGADPGALLLAQRAYDAALANQRSLEARAAQGRAAERATAIAAARQSLNEAIAALQAAAGRPDALPAAARRAEGALGAAVSALERLRSAGAAGELSAAESALSAAEAAAALASARLDALQAGPSPTELAVAQSQYDAAKAQADALQARVDSAETGELNEQVRQAETALDLAQLALLGSILVAPFDGVVASVDAGRGALVSGPFLTLADVRELRVVANLPASIAGSLQLGQEATISLDLLPGSAFAGRVAALPQFAADDGTFPVSFAFLNPSESIRVGMQASVQGTILLRERALLVPTSALRGEGSTRTVDVWSASRATPRDIRIGLITDDWAEVLGGLDENERVLVYRGRRG